MSGTTTAQTQTKRPGDLRQDTNRAASDSDTYQEASAMSETTGTLPESADLMAALGDITGRRVRSIADLLAYAREHGTTADELVAQAQHDVAADWHPDWCARTEHCTPNSPHGDIHYSRPRVLRKMDTASSHGTDGGESFRAELRVAEGTEAGESFDHSAELVIRNEEGVGDLELHIGANRMRRLAAWLMEMAEWVEAVHAGRDPQAVIQEQQEARR